MYYINKWTLAIVNPVNIGLLLMLLSLMAACRGNGSKCFKLLVTMIVWFWFWGCGFSQVVMSCMFSLGKYPIVPIEAVPNADAIVDLGGGVGVNAAISSCPELTGSSDRALYSARLWKEGKAPVVLATGGNVVGADKPLLMDFGVPADAIVLEPNARNTEENAIFTERVLLKHLQKDHATVLLVTSISHMRRAMMIFKKSAPHLSCIPVACDHSEVCYLEDLCWKHFIPSCSGLAKNMVVYKECLGILGYWLRGFRDE